MPISPRRFALPASALLCLVLAAAALADDGAAALAERAKSLFGTLPPEAASQSNPVTDAKVSLGRMLYHDTRLSISQTISCNSCHVLERFGVDNEATSIGHDGRRGDRNSPTVYHAAFHVAQFWDGRAKDVEEQAKGPVGNPVEMGMPDAAHVDRVLRSIPGYAPLFAAAFPGQKQPVSFDNAALAIAAFERRLVTPSPFDAFQQGDTSALTAQQQRGLATFLEVGCTTCHVGPVVGGSMFQKLGLVHPYESADPGRFKVTGNEADRSVFKVPSLRNVTEIGPWFHDGSVGTLEEAIRLMGWHQLGRKLDDAQVADIAAFLKSLTGRIDADQVAKPELPPNGPTTPGPG